MSLRKYNNSRVLCVCVCVRFDFRTNRAVGCITFLLCHFCHSYMNMWLIFTIRFMMALNEVRASHDRYHIGAHVILLRVEFLVCYASDTRTRFQMCVVMKSKVDWTFFFVALTGMNGERLVLFFSFMNFEFSFDPWRDRERNVVFILIQCFCLFGCKHFRFDCQIVICWAKRLHTIYSILLLDIHLLVEKSTNKSMVKTTSLCDDFFFSSVLILLLFLDRSHIDFCLDVKDPKCFFYQHQYWIINVCRKRTAEKKTEAFCRWKWLQHVLDARKSI